MIIHLSKFLSVYSKCLGAKTVLLPLSAGYPSRALLPTLAIKIIKKGNEHKKGQGQLQEEEGRKRGRRGKGLLMALTPYPRLHMSTTAPHPNQFTFGFWGLREPPDEMSTKFPAKGLQLDCISSYLLPFSRTSSVEAPRGGKSHQ